MENYMFFKVMKDFKSDVPHVPIKMNPGVVPHIFDCCKNHTSTDGSGPRNNESEARDEEETVGGLSDADIMCINENEADSEHTKDIQKRLNVDSIPIQPTESEVDINITDVNTVGEKLQNFINYEVGVDEFEDTNLISGDFLQDSSSSGSSKGELNRFKLIQEEQNASDQEVNEISNKGIRNSRDSDDDAFEEQVCSEKPDYIQILDQQPIDLTEDVENTSDVKSEDSTGIHFLISENKEAEDCVTSNTTEQKNESAHKLVGSYVGVEADAVKPITVEDSDSDECIVITEDEDSMDVDIKICNVNRPIKEITEQYILQEYEIMDDEEDICVISEGSEKPKKIIRRKDQLYYCPFDCTYLVDRKNLMIKHLINHKKEELQEKKGYVCPICYFDSLDKLNFVDHIMYHELRFACRKCTYIAQKPSLLKSHMNTKHGMTLSCHNCQYRTRQLGQYLNHQVHCMQKKKSKRLKEDGDYFKCHFDPCPFRAASKETLKTHEWIQHQVGSDIIQNFKCYIDHCSVETCREEVFTDHISAHPGCELQCQQCSYKTLDWKRFKDHIIMHVVKLSNVEVPSTPCE